MRHLWTILPFILAALFLHGCGNVNDVAVSNDAPVANAGPDLGSLSSGTVITLNGSASTDPNGDPLTYSWTFLSKPAGSAAVLTNPTSVTPSFTVDRAGDYVVQLIVNDGAVNSTPDSAIISTNNVAPVANAGPDQGGKALGSLVTLDGSASTDGDGDPLTFSWSLTAKPAGSAAVLANPTSVTPTFTVDRDGDYVVQLIVNDGTLDSALDTVIITSNNVAPVANAGPDQGGIALGSLVTLNGSASSDANGDPLTFSWSLTSKPAGSAAVLTGANTVSPTFTVDRAGAYVVQLIVNDGTVNSAPNTVSITTVNVAPVANAGPDQGGKALGSLVTLNGSASSDADGDPLTFRWSLTAKPSGSIAVLSSPTSVTPTFTVDLVGDYTAQLIVNDGTVSSAPNTVNISVNISTVNVAPVANAGPDQGGKALGSLVTLNGSASSDADGDPLTFRWSLTAKPSGSIAVLSSPTSVTPTVTVDLAGIYTAQLIVNDGTVSSAPNTVRISTVNVAAMTITTDSLPNGRTNQAYAATLAVSGGTIPYTWSVTPDLPAELMLAPATGVISGTATATSNSKYDFTVRDSTNQTRTKELRLRIRKSAPSDDDDDDD